MTALLIAAAESSDHLNWPDAIVLAVAIIVIGWVFVKLVG